MKDNDKVLTDAYREYKQIEPKQPELKRSEYIEPETWKIAAAKAIAVISILLSVTVGTLGFVGLVLTIFTGVDGDSYSASLGIWSLIALAFGGFGFLFGWTFWRISKQ